LADDVDNLYRPFDQISEKDGVIKCRRIDNPSSALKLVQRRIKTALLDTVDMPPELMGGVKGRSVQDNVRAHVGQPQVVTLDMKDYFPRITNAMVAAALKHTFGCSHDVTWLLTRLTTYRGHLPQGAPTSTALANLVFVPTNSDIRGICARTRLRHSSWVDDLAISGRQASGALPDVIAALKRGHFRLSRRKLKIMGRNERQEVTRLVVNRKVSLGRDRLSRYRRDINHARAPEGNPARVAGEIAFAQAIAPDQGAALKRRLGRCRPRQS
jgi:RNA-directed DNA polymerase